ncbi:MAG TPA: SCO family protein [Rhizomicrobium sp.]|nr:SCO family protein [Rhizomicrobium sp.]
MLRTPIALVPYLFLCLFVAGGALWSIAAAEGGGLVYASGGADTATLGGPFRLTDQNGRVRTDADFHGGYVLLYFGYSFCPDVCPTTLASIAAAMDRMGKNAARITPVFVTVDPARDTPKVLKTYLAAFGPRFVGLTGPDKAIARLAREYRVYYAKRPLEAGGYAMDHSGQLYLLGPDGRLVTFYDFPIDPKKLAADLERRLAGS